MKKGKKELMSMMMDNSAEEMEMDDSSRSAKMDVIRELMGLTTDQAGKRMKSDMEEMQKVTVAAPDTEGLIAGLEKAEEVVTDMPEMLMAEEDDMMEEEVDAMATPSIASIVEELMPEPSISMDDDEMSTDGLSIADQKKLFAKMMMK